MKKYILTLAISLLGYYSYAQTQWATTGADIYNTNTGYVGVGTNAPITRFDVLDANTNVYSAPVNGGGIVKIRNAFNATVSGAFSSLYLTVTNNNGSSNAVGTINLIQTSARHHDSDFAFQLRNRSGEYFEAMRMTSTQRVGIGINGPSAKLHILSSNGTTEQLRLGYDAENYVSHTVNTSGNYTIAPTGGTTTITGVLAATGNISAGIIQNGTSVLKASLNFSANGLIASRNVADANAAFMVDQANASSTGAIQKWKFAGSDVATITSSGMLGLGTSTPNAILQTTGSAAAANSIGLLVHNKATTSAGTSVSIDFANTTSSLPVAAARIAAIRTNRAHTVDTDLGFYTFSNNTLLERMRIMDNGNIGIGTKQPDQKLSVNGTIHAKEVKIDLANWPDYVFKPTYKLLSLTEIKAYIDKNNHLPDIPSEQEAKDDGINLGEMNKILVKKVEELTLYLIDKDQQLTDQQKKNNEQEERIAALEKALSKLTSK